MDEDLDAIGSEIEVTRTIGTDHNDGRIFFRGTTWNARSTKGEIPKESTAILHSREGNTWIVTPK